MNKLISVFLALLMLLGISVSALAWTYDADSKTLTVCPHEDITLTVEGPADASFAQITVTGSAEGNTTAKPSSASDSKTVFKVPFSASKGAADGSAFKVTFQYYDADKQDLGKDATYTVRVVDNMKQTAAVAATCTSVGNPNYYTCSICGKHFADVAGKQALSSKDLVTEKTDHHWVANGVQFKCSLCGAITTENVSGKTDNFTGFMKKDGKYIYYVNGNRSSASSDVVYGTINGSTGWYYIAKGVFTKTTTIAKNAHGWWRIENGKVNFKYNGIGHNGYGWWKCKNGKVDFSYNGIAHNENGWWKCSNGRVTFKETGVYKNENGWWFCEHSKVKFNYNGLASNQFGTWVIKNGKVNFKYNGKYRYNKVNFTVKNGKVV